MADSGNQSSGSSGPGSSLLATVGQTSDSSTIDDTAVSSLAETLSNFAVSEPESNVQDFKYLLISSDKEHLRISKELADRIGFIKEALELLPDPDRREPILLDSVHSDTLCLVLVYLKQNKISTEPFKTPEAETAYAENRAKWNKKFVENLSQTEFHNLMQAADRMDIPDLLKLCCNHVASQIKGKSPISIRDLFGIPHPVGPRKRNIICKKTLDEFLQANEHKGAVVFTRIRDNE